MGFFNKFDRAEAGATHDGQEISRNGMIDVVFWRPADADALVHKVPCDNLVHGAQLIVNESQNAYLFNGGTYAQEYLSPGSPHQLDSANIPGMQKSLTKATGGQTPYTSEIWFVSNQPKLNIRWGIGDVPVMDPVFDIPVKIGAHGQYGFKIIDGATFIKQAVGTIHDLDTMTIYTKFLAYIQSSIADTLGALMVKRGISVVELLGKLTYEELAMEAKQRLDPLFAPFGIDLTHFAFQRVAIDENDEAYQAVKKGMAEGSAEKQRLARLGINYAQERQLDIAQAAASNEGAGTFMGAGIGLGMGMGLGGPMGNMMGNMMQGMPTPPPPPPSSNFYVAQNGQTTGPFNEMQLRELKNSGALTPQTLVCRVGNQAWAAAGTQPELAGVFGETPPPPPPPVPGQ